MRSPAILPGDWTADRESASCSPEPGTSGTPGRLVEGVLDAVAPEHVNANSEGEVLQWLNGNRGEDIDEVDGRIDRGLREIREFREQRIEALECPARTAAARDVGLQSRAAAGPRGSQGYSRCWKPPTRHGYRRIQSLQIEICLRYRSPRPPLRPQTRVPIVCRLS